MKKLLKEMIVILIVEMVGSVSLETILLRTVLSNQSKDLSFYQTTNTVVVHQDISVLGVK